MCLANGATLLQEKQCARLDEISRLHSVEIDVSREPAPVELDFKIACVQFAILEKGDLLAEVVGDCERSVAWTILFRLLRKPVRLNIAEDEFVKSVELDGLREQYFSHPTCFCLVESQP